MTAGYVDLHMLCPPGTETMPISICVVEIEAVQDTAHGSLVRMRLGGRYEVAENRSGVLQLIAPAKT